jgi:hypothetical protein
MSGNKSYSEAKFDGFVDVEPTGEWEYEVDDNAVQYGAGLWPFYSTEGEPSQPTSVKLAPNSEYGWGNTQCVMMTILPERALAVVSLEVFVRPQGLGGWVHELEAEIGLVSDAWRWRIQPAPEIIVQANVKRDKILKFLRLARQQRDAGQRAPVTAWERYYAAVALHANTSPESCVHSIAEMEARGFKIILASRTICVTEVHFNGPFHLKFDSGDIVRATEIESDYGGIRSTHRVVLSGGFDGDKVAFQAIED